MTDNTRIGATVAGYRIQSLLGRGGMSIVYLAEHVQLGRIVALKLLAPSLCLDPDFRERFAYESRRASEVEHPNVVPIFDAGEAEGQLFIAMRYIEGCDLKTLIRRDGSLGIGRTLFILEQAGDALDAAHDQGLIHRDVKPANILVSEPSDRVYLTDFGIVKHTASQGLTKTGFLLGTIDYAAPEQIEGLPVDARTDVYALGCVLYECLAGQAPFERDSELAVMHAHLVQAPPALSSVRPDLARGLDAVIAKAMAKAKDDRFATCAELIAAARLAALERRPTSAADVVVAVSPHASEPVVVAATGAALAAPPPRDPAAAPGAPSTPAMPPPAPAVAPVAAPASRRSGPSLVVIAGVMLVAAILSGLATYLFTRGSGTRHAATTGAPTTPSAASGGTTSQATETTSSTASSTTSQGTATTPALGGQAQILQAMITDPAIAKSCKKARFPGGLATLLCTAKTAGGATIQLHVDHFGTVQVLKHGYSNDAVSGFTAAGGVANRGACSSATWLGEGPWGGSRGRRACFLGTASTEGCTGLGHVRCAMIYWYEEPSRVFVRAVLPGTDTAALADWWTSNVQGFHA